MLITFLFWVNVLYSESNPLTDSWRWTKFNTECGLPSNRVFDVEETQSGTIWAATQAGVAFYNGYYWETIREDRGLPQDFVSKITPTNNDSICIIINSRLYVGCSKGFHKVNFLHHGRERSILSVAPFNHNKLLILSDSVLFLYENNSITAYQFTNELKKAKIFGLYHTGKNRIWLNTSFGLYVWGNEHWLQKLPQSKPPMFIQYLEENQKGKGIMYIAGPNESYGLWTWDERENLVHLTPESMGNIIGVDIAQDNSILLIKESNEVRIRRDGVWQALDRPPAQLQTVLFIKYRPNGDLWVGTEDGLFINKASSKRWKDWRFPSPDQRNNVNAILPRKDGTVWVATGGGLVIHNKDDAFETITNILGTQIGTVTGVEEDCDGNVWICSGSSFDGAFKWNGKKWEHYGYRDGLDAGMIHKVKRDIHGQLWFLGLFRSDCEQRNVDPEPGAYLLENGKFTHFGKNEGLEGGRVFAFAEDATGTWYFGTNVGISKRSSDGKWKYWNTTNGLKTNRIFTIAVDKQNKVWFGDQTFGLGFIDNDTAKYLTTSDGLISNAVWDLEVDESGKLWIGTRGGVSIYSNGIWSKLDLKDGFENIRIWPISIYEQQVYFGTSGGGIEILNLNELNKTSPKLILSSPVVEGNTVHIQWRAFAQWGEQDPDDIEIRYRVDKKDWTKWNRERYILLSNISSGSHTFQIQVKNLMGEFDTAGQTIIVSVPYPPYLQPRFVIPLGLLLASLIILGTKYLSRKRKSDAAIKKSEIRYRNLFETANDAIIIFEPENEIILEVNKKACEIYGFTKSELIGMSLKKISKNVSRGEGMIQQVLEDPNAKAFETEHFAKDGKILFIHINASVIDFDGQKAILSLNRDVTEQKQTEAKIRLLAQTVASAKDCIYITDLEGSILFVNEAFAREHGYNADELPGKNISLINSQSKFSELRHKQSSGIIGGSWYGEIQHCRKDGTSFPVELWSSVVYNENNEPVAIVGVSRNISDRKRYEQDREQLIAELKEALAEVKTLTGLLPICSSCKKIRDDGGYWTQVETYVAKHSDAVFTHGLCPDCTKELFPEVYDRLKKRKSPNDY